MKKLLIIEATTPLFRVGYEVNMRKKWLALLMAAMMTTTAIAPSVYAEELESFEIETDQKDSEENIDAEGEMAEVPDLTEDENIDIEEPAFEAEETTVFSDTDELVSGENDSISEEFSDGTENVEDVFAVGAEDNSAPYSSIDKLENGTYTVTANVYVPGELNKVLVGTNAFLTNPKYPFGSGADKGKPTTAMYYNAELNVNDNDIKVTLELKNPVFQAIQINDGSNVTIVDKTYNDDLSNSEIHTKYGKKIQTLTLKLKDFGGLYEFGDCKEFASILYTEGNSATETDAVWDVPLKLAVDFQGIGKQETSVVTNFLNPDLQVALVTNKELPEGTTEDMREITADSEGEDGRIYREFDAFFKENETNSNNLGFRAFYIGLKDSDGNVLSNIEKYNATFYTQASGFFEGFDGQQGQAMARIENGKLTTNIVHGGVGDAGNDLAIFETEDGVWDYTFSYEEGTFSGGYIFIYDKDAYIPFTYHVEDSDTCIAMNYYGVSATGRELPQEEEANDYYRIKTAKNKYGIGDQELELQLKEKSGYQKVFYNTYQMGMYSMVTDPSSNEILYLSSRQKMGVEIPIGELSDFQIYKIIYDKNTSSYLEIEPVTDYTLTDGTASFYTISSGLSSSKIRTAQRLYGAIATDDYKGSKAKAQIQYYAVVSEGAVADKPSISNTTFTYDGTEKSLIPENQYYTVSGDVSKKLPGSYKVTVALKDGYAWKDGTTDPVEFTWNIKALQTQKPVVVNGLTYNGKNQTGVKAGKGYNLAGTYTAKNVGSYKTKVLLAEGYEWSDGTTDPLTLTWSIDKAGQAVKTKVTTKSYTFTSLKKKAASFTIGASGQGTISYKVVKAPSKASKYITVDKKGKVTVKKGAKIGTYVVRISAAGNSDYKAAAKDVTVKVTKLTQKITAKVSGKTYKAASLKKKAATFSIGAKAKTSVSYKVVKAPSKASKYISVSKTGKVTLKKKAPKGTYEIRVTAKANGTYNAAARTIKVVVK